MDSNDNFILELPDIILSVGDHLRPLVEGSEVVKKGILSVGKIEATGDYLEVFALVVQCSKIDEAPHGVTTKITLSANGEKTVKSKCSCIGGQTGQCKHCIAVALRLTRLRVSDLETVSCTDMKQRWGKPQMEAYSKQEFAGVPLAKQCHFRPRDGAQLKFTKEQRNGLLQEFLKGAEPDCELAKFLSFSRFYEEHSAPLPVHKSVSRAIKSAATSATTLPKPKAQTLHQLKASAEARKQEADAGSTDVCDAAQKQQPDAGSTGVCEQVHQEDVEDVRQMLKRAVETGLEISQSPSHPQSGNRMIRAQVEVITALLQTILPSIEQDDLEDGEGVSEAPLAQSTPKECNPKRSSAAAEIATPKRVPLKDRTNIMGTNPLAIYQEKGCAQKKGQTKKGGQSKENTSGLQRREKLQQLKEQYEKNCEGRGDVIPSFSTSPEDWISNKFKINIAVHLGVSPPVISNEDNSILYQSRIAVSEEQAVKICMETVAQSDCPAWQARRNLVFTGSSAYEIFRRRLNLEDNLGWDKFLTSRLQPKRDVWTMERGLKDEPFAKRIYELKTGRKIYNLGACIHPKIPHLLSSPDGVVLEDDTYIEVKSPELGIMSSAEDIIPQLSYIYYCNGTARLREKDKYYGQVQMAMAILSLKQTHVVIYASFDNSISVVNVPFNASFVKEYFDKLTNIYVKHNLGLLKKLDI